MVVNMNYLEEYKKWCESDEFDKETKQELAIIQKVIDGRKYQYVIKNSALEDEIIESMFRYNNSIWEWFE